MGSVIRRRIPIENIKMGMTLAEDVINNKGLMLIPANTVINQKHIFRLNLYQILSIVIKENLDNLTEESTQTVSTIKSQVSTVSHKSFDNFSENYMALENSLHTELDIIGNGGQVEEDTLLSISTSLLQSLRTNNDLFNYLYHLQSSDDYTYSHSLNVSLLCNIFAHWLQLPKEDIEGVTIAGLLHDIGNIKLRYDILHKPGKLTAEEFKEIKRHPMLGYNLIKDLNFSSKIKLGVLMHHERIDGSGYPQGLTDDKITDYAKIIAIADIYDAMTSNRSYHRRFSPFQVISIFEQESFGILDTKLLFVFLENIAHNYLRNTVLLSTGEEAKVVFIHNNSPSRPIVQVGDVMIDLLFETSITIEEIL